ncbi:hypothetical protein CRUP_036482 [Coryphaenoides rupestris]|nr:hypothetical protein CRUP_036482 [Coryphaenoides rupestris]
MEVAPRQMSDRSECRTEERRAPPPVLRPLLAVVHLPCAAVRREPRQHAQQLHRRMSENVMATETPGEMNLGMGWGRREMGRGQEGSTDGLPRVQEGQEGQYQTAARVRRVQYRRPPGSGRVRRGGSSGSGADGSRVRRVRRVSTDGSRVRRVRRVSTDGSRVRRVSTDGSRKARVTDFKVVIMSYLESLVQTQQQLIKYWEAFLPEAKAIS